MKIVINTKYGGFGLSPEAIDTYVELSGLKLYKEYDEQWKSNSYYTVPVEEYHKLHKNDMTKTEWEGKEEGWGRYRDSNAVCWSWRDIERNDPVLVQVVETMCEQANGSHAELKVVEIPDDVDWEISDYDGREWVAEKHRIWD
jgi:hypothetical protein